MIQIRQGVFETNSSSTHSICIAKDYNSIPNEIHFHLGYFGWDTAEVNAADYLYTAIVDSGMNAIEKYLPQLMQFLDKNNIVYSFEGIPEWIYKTNSWESVDLSQVDFFAIDHVDLVQKFLEQVFLNENLLAGLLLGNSKVYTGSDNYPIENFPQCEAAFPTYWAYDEASGNSEEVNNPYHMPEKYTYFYKGN